MRLRPTTRLRVVRRRRPALAALAVLLFALVGVMEMLLVRSSNEIRSTTAAFTDAGYAITDLANVQRESLALARDLEQTSPNDHEAIKVRAELLANQWRLYRVDVEAAGRDRSSMDEIAGSVTGLVADIARVDELERARGHDATLQDLRGRLREIEILIKREYDRQEITYIGTFQDALHSRSASEFQLLVLSGAVVLLAILVLGLARRGVRKDFHDAYERLGESEERYRSVVDQVNEAIIQLDADGCVSFCNRAWTGLTGTSAEHSIGRPLTEFLEEEDREVFASALRVARRRGEPLAQSERRLRDGRGGTRWVEIDLLPRPAGGHSGTLVDVTERVSALAELERMAMRDSLTGLANRSELTIHLQHAMQRSKRSGQPVAVLYLDLDRFKLVNDSLGHDVGDLLLRRVGDLLTDCIRTTDVAARLGGDEFVVVCESLPIDPVAAVEEALGVAQRILDAIGRPQAIEGRELIVTASVGIALGMPGQRHEQLLSNSDAAMYRAKDRGKACIEVFDEELRVEVERRASIEHDLHWCVTRDELEMWLQPVYSLADGDLIRMEALLRWRHPRHGLLEPAAFLSIAEETGHIEALGSWILREACTAASRWPSGIGGTWPGVAVNVSGHQLKDGRILGEVEAVLADTGLAADRLCLEITETVYAAADPRTLKHVELLRSSGVSVAMDDFGTGYSSLSSLRSFPINIVKLDRSFVAGLGTSLQDDAIARSVIELGGSLGFETTAEGVEEPRQASRLIDLGCTQVQGYLFGRPVPVEKAASIIAAGSVDLQAILRPLRVTG